MHVLQTFVAMGDAVLADAYFFAIREAKFIMDGISKKLIKDGIHSTIRVNFPRISEFLATTLLVISRSADFVSC